jgi:uncharacterized alpha-E superfamily protein
MLARIADSLFWMARYMERADGMLRMLRINCITSLDQNGLESSFSWEPTLRLFSANTDAQPAPDQTDEVLRYMIFNKDNTGSIRNIVARTRENARGGQDHLTKEAWESINEFHLKLNNPELEAKIIRGEQIVMLGELIQHGIIFTGVAEVTMARGQGWNYMNIGKFVERAILTIDILDLRFSQIGYDLSYEAEVNYWRNLLLSLSGYELYLKQYPSGFDSRNVAHLAILNSQFPRSLAYCLFRLDRTIQIVADENPANAEPLRKLMGRLRSKVEFADMDIIEKMGLQRFLADLKADFYQLSNTIGTNFFARN